MTTKNKQGTWQSELRRSLAVIGAGVSKLAEMADLSAKQAASPVASDAVKEQATNIASKLASLGYGTEYNVTANAEVLARSHADALEATQAILDVIGAPNNKTADSPGQLGKAASRGSEPVAKRDVYRPIRC